MKNGFNKNPNQNWNKEKWERKETNPSTVSNSAQEDVSSEDSAEYSHEKNCNGCKNCR